MAIAGFLALAVIVSSEALAIWHCYDGIERPYREPAHSLMNAVFAQAR